MHTEAIYRFRPEPVSRIILSAQFRQKHKGQVYLYAITDGEAIKFGSAWDVDARLKILQIGNSRELRCIGAILAKKGTESAVHKALFFQRLRGEWFTICQQTARMVDLYSAGDASALYAHLDNYFAKSC